MVKAVIFDWGRTLYDTDTNQLYPGVWDVLVDLLRHYELGLVGVSNGNNPANSHDKVLDESGVYSREQLIESFGIHVLFSEIIIGKPPKVDLYVEILNRLGLQSHEIAIVDDNLEGIAWGNNNGAVTLWYDHDENQKDKPERECDYPKYTFHAFHELKIILKK